MTCPRLARDFHRVVNMTPAQIRSWSKDPRAKCFSQPDTRARLPALAALKAKSTSAWSSADCKFASRVVSFNRRMQGALDRDGCRDGYAVSLRNWGRQPPRCAVPKSPKCPRRQK